MMKGEIRKAFRNTMIAKGFMLVRPAWAYSNGCKSLSRPDNGKATAKDKGVRGDAESEGSRRQTSALTDRNMI